MLSTHLIQEIEQQTHDLACTLRLYQQQYGKLPVNNVASSLLVTLLENGSLDYGLNLNASAGTPTPGEVSFLGILQHESNRMLSEGRFGLGYNYQHVLSSLRQFLGEQHLHLSALTPDLIKQYETWLFNVCGISRNTSSCYMRQLRAVYNRAVRRALVTDQRPFEQVYTGIDRTEHRALSLNQIRAIHRLDLSRHPLQTQARDLFMFSFYTQGMSFVDMAYLRKEALSGNRLTYIRHKSHQTVTLRWEPEMQRLVERLWQNAASAPLSDNAPTDPQHTPYLLPILSPAPTDQQYHQYLSASHKCNNLLHQLEPLLSLPIRLTMYVARHSWATGAFHAQMPVEAIGAALGHSQGAERTTRIYLDTLSQMDTEKQKREIIEKVK